MFWMLENLLTVLFRKTFHTTWLTRPKHAKTVRLGTHRVVWCNLILFTYEIKTSHKYATGNNSNVKTKTAMVVTWGTYTLKKATKLVTFMVLFMRIGHILSILSRLKSVWYLKCLHFIQMAAPQLLSQVQCECIYPEEATHFVLENYTQNNI